MLICMLQLVITVNDIKRKSPSPFKMADHVPSQVLCPTLWKPCLQEQNVSVPLEMQ